MTDGGPIKNKIVKFYMKNKKSKVPFSIKNFEPKSLDISSIDSPLCIENPIPKTVMDTYDKKTKAG